MYINTEKINYDYSNVSVQCRQVIPAFAGSADIHVSPGGKFLYASNRGDANTIAIFRVNKKAGTLTLLGHQPTLGKNTPKFQY